MTRTRWIPIALAPLLASCQILAGIDEKHAATVDAAAPASTECTTNQDCIDKKGEPAICRKPDKTCHVIATPECARLIGSVADDSTILLGLVQDLRGSNAGRGVARLQSAELAVNEITQTTRGIPGGEGGRPRPIAIVACSENLDSASPADPTVAGRFLVDTLRVPAILGGGNSGTTIDLATNVTIPAGVLLFSPSATSEIITDLQPRTATPRLVWRTAPSNAIEAKALRLAMGALEAEVRPQAGAGQVKVAVAVKGDAFGTGLWALTKDGLTINGTPVTDPGNAAILVRQYSASPTTAELTAIASAISDFAPHIVFSVGTAEAIGGILSPVEATWAARHPSQAPPHWLFSDGGQTTQVLDAVATGDLRTRVRGTVPGSRGRLYDTFLERYGEVYPDGPPVTFGSAGAYDIVYLLAYATVAAPATDPPDGPLTGARLASGLLRAVTGDASTSRVEVGPNGLNPGFQQLAQGGAIKFTGASGSLDFDVAVGEAPSDIDVWCITQSGAPGFRSSGVYYSADADSLIGTYACPAN